MILITKILFSTVNLKAYVGGHATGFKVGTEMYVSLWPSVAYNIDTVGTRTRRCIGFEHLKSNLKEQKEEEVAIARRQCTVVHRRLCRHSTKVAIGAQSLSLVHSTKVTQLPAVQKPPSIVGIPLHSPFARSQS